MRTRNPSGRRAAALLYLSLVLLPAGFVTSCSYSRVVAPPQSVPSRILIQHVAVLDVSSGVRLANQDVLVEADQIKAIAPSPGFAHLEADLEIDGSGATLLPGLIDLHAHTGINPAPASTNAWPDAAANLAAYLYCGVTTVADLGGLTPAVIDRRDQVAAGKLLGPTLYVAGPVLTTTGGHPIPVLRMMLPAWLGWYAIPRYAIQAGNPAEAAAAAERIVAMGVDFLKVIVDRIPNDAPRIDNRSLAAAVGMARRLGVRSLAHIGTTQDALDSGQAGVAAWAHGVYRERILDEDIPKLAAFGIPMIPTIVGFESLASAGSRGRQSTALERETVSPEVLAQFDQLADAPMPEFAHESASFLATQRENWRDNVRRLHAAGVTILAGSDMQSGVFPGAGLHRELGYLTEAGLTRLEAIRATTIEAARFLEAKQDPSFGMIAPGKRADLLLVEGDPLADLDNLARIRAVIVRGLPVKRIAVGH